jgi:hypothetical protein
MEGQSKRLGHSYNVEVDTHWRAFFCSYVTVVQRDFMYNTTIPVTLRSLTSSIR